jgi:hypothetical protein
MKKETVCIGGTMDDLDRVLNKLSYAQLDELNSALLDISDGIMRKGVRHKFLQKLTVFEFIELFQRVKMRMV